VITLIIVLDEFSLTITKTMYEDRTEPIFGTPAESTESLWIYDRMSNDTFVIFPEVRTHHSHYVRQITESNSVLVKDIKYFNRETAIERGVEAMKFVRRRFPGTNITMMGFGFGGALVLHLASKVDFDAIIVSDVFLNGIELYNDSHSPVNENTMMCVNLGYRVCWYVPFIHNIEYVGRFVNMLSFAREWNNDKAMNHIPLRTFPFIFEYTNNSIVPPSHSIRLAKMHPSAQIRDVQ